MLVIQPISLPFAGLDALAAEARAEGFRFVDRMITKWETGKARFSGPGELLLGAFEDGVVAGIAGLVRDPYRGDCRTGRLRHLYVRPYWRRRGIATALV